jgi:hypothetical protein
LLHWKSSFKEKACEHTQKYNCSGFTSVVFILVVGAVEVEVAEVELSVADNEVVLAVATDEFTFAAIELTIAVVELVSLEVKLLAVEEVADVFLSKEVKLIAEEEAAVICIIDAPASGGFVGESELTNSCDPASSCPKVEACAAEISVIEIASSGELAAALG